MTARCAVCRHPLAGETWVAPQGPPASIISPSGTWGPPSLVEHTAYLSAVEHWLQEISVDPIEIHEHQSDALWAWVHYSPCDDECDHDGPGRVDVGTGHGVEWGAWHGPMIDGPLYEASWRLDFRLAIAPKVTVDWNLCLRCWASAADLYVSDECRSNKHDKCGDDGVCVCRCHLPEGYE